MNRRTVNALLATCTLAAGLAACAPSKPAEQSAPSSGATSTGYPVTVRNCGHDVTIAQRPTKVVAFDGAAETVFALGAANQLAGYFGAKPEALPGPLAEQARMTTRIGGTFPAPTLESATKDKPDLVLLYGENSKGGLTGTRLKELGIPHLHLSEGCAESPDPTVDGYFRDVTAIAAALGKEAEGKKLLKGWRDKLASLETKDGQTKPGVLVSGNTDPKAPFASGKGSFVQDQLTRAGARNVYEDSPKGYLSPSWEDVATRNPDIIIDGSGGMNASRDALLAHLKASPALARMTAAAKDHVFAIPFSQNVPGPQAVDGIIAISEIVAKARS